MNRSVARPISILKAFDVDVVQGRLDVVGGLLERHRSGAVERSLVRSRLSWLDFSSKTWNLLFA